MTREEQDKAIRILQWLHDNYFLFRSTEEDVKYATKLAIQELQKESCEDAISRQAVIDLLYGEVKETYTISNGRITYHITDINVDDLMNIPSVTPQQKAESAEWVDDKCSACGKGIEDLISSPEWYRNEEPYFCPYCGVKIQKSEESICK